MGMVGMSAFLALSSSSSSIRPTTTLISGSLYSLHSPLGCGTAHHATPPETVQDAGPTCGSHRLVRVAAPSITARRPSSLLQSPAAVSRARAGSHARALTRLTRSVSLQYSARDTPDTSLTIFQRRQPAQFTGYGRSADSGRSESGLFIPTMTSLPSGMSA